MLVADFYTKPLQGSLFKIFRNMILNIEDRQVEHYLKLQNIMGQKPVSVVNTGKGPQECVGKCDQIKNMIENKTKQNKLSYKDILVKGKPKEGCKSRYKSDTKLQGLGKVRAL